MIGNATQGSISYETRLRVLKAVRSLALQGARIETHLRKTRWEVGTGTGTKDCGCGASDSTATPPVAASTPLPPDERTAAAELACKGLELLQSARLANRALRKAQANADTILAATNELDIMKDPKAWRGAMNAFVGSPKAIADTRRLLAHYGFNIDVAEHVISELNKLNAPPALAKDLKALKFYQKAQDAKIGQSSSALTGDDLSGAIDDAPIDVSFEGGTPVVSVRCEKLPAPADVGCTIVVIGVFIVVGVVALGYWLVDVFNGTDDDQARDKINSSTCPTLSALPIDTRVSMMQAMISGPTGDDDENAIARLLECSPCEDVRTLISRVGGVDRLLGEFHGSEWDRLMIRLQQCDLVDFGDWDDDATRRFINGSDCATLNALRINDIRQLILNLFSGHTGDDDENAILKLIGCLPCERRRTLMTMSRVSFSDFDDEVDGSEWRRLRSLLRC